MLIPSRARRRNKPMKPTGERCEFFFDVASHSPLARRRSAAASAGYRMRARDDVNRLLKPPHAGAAVLLHSHKCAIRIPRTRGMPLNCPAPGEPVQLLIVSGPAFVCV